MYTFKFPSLCSFIELNRIFYFELLFYKISTLGFISLNLFLCFLKYSTSLCSISSWKYESFIYSFLIFIIFFLELLYCPKSSILNQSAGIDNFIFIICFFGVHHFSIFRMRFVETGKAQRALAVCKVLVQFKFILAYFSTSEGVQKLNAYFFLQSIQGICYLWLSSLPSKTWKNK